MPRDLETICLKCLQKEPRKRYATAKELADDLNRFLVGEPIKARRTHPIERSWKWVKRNPTRATLLGFATTAFVGLCIYGGWYWNHQRKLERLAAKHEAEVREATGDDLLQAQGLIAKNQLDQARDRLFERKIFLDRENIAALAALKDRTRQMLADVEKLLAADQARLAEQQARDAVQKRLGHFLDLRKEALFPTRNSRA